MFGLATPGTVGQSYGMPTAPSSGFGNVSVYNRSLDTVTNDVPSVLVLPSNHTKISPTSQPQNNFLANDLVFALSEKAISTAPKFSEHRERYGGGGVPLVTLPMLNNLIKEMAIANPTDRSWGDPSKVASWATPMGAVLNTMRVGGDTTSYRQPKSYVNVQVSRRAQLKNNFFSVSCGATGDWHARSMDKLVVHYSIEECHQTDASKTRLSVVMVSLLLMDADFEGLPDRKSPVSITKPSGQLRVPTDESIRDFALEPTTENSVTVEIGRVLHSPPRAPTAGEALLACYDKQIYDRLKPIEVELGAP